MRVVYIVRGDDIEAKYLIISIAASILNKIA